MSSLTAAGVAQFVDLRKRVYEKRRVTWTVADQVLVSLCNFLTTYLLARHLPIAEFGLYSVAFVGLLFLNSVQHGLIVQPQNVLGARLEGREYRLFTTVLTVAQAAGAVLLGLAAAATGAAVWRFASAEYGILVLFFAATVVPWMFQEHVRRVLYARSKSKAAFRNDLASYGLQLSGIALLIFAWDSVGKEQALLVLAGSSAVAGIYGLWQIRGYLSFADWNAGEALAICRRTWDFGRWLVAKNLVDWFGKYGDTWVLLALLGPAPLGTYKAVTHVLNVLNPLRQSLQVYAPARMSRSYVLEGGKGLHAKVRQVYLLVGAPYVAVTLILAIFAGPVLALLYGDRFLGLGLEWLVAIGAVAHLVAFLRSPLQMALLAMQQGRLLFWTSLVPLLLLATAGVLLIRQFGMIGAPIFTLLSGAVMLIVLGMIYRRHLLGGDPSGGAPGAAAGTGG